MEFVLVLALIALAICYIVFIWSSLVTAKRADERIEEMKRKLEDWNEYQNRP